MPDFICNAISCFDFPDADSVLLKVKEESAELETAMKCQDISQIEEEMGDLLLSITSLCRKLGVDAEEALNKATDKFISRFEAIENEVISSGLSMENLSMEQLDAIWDKNKAKSVEK